MIAREPQADEEALKQAILHEYAEEVLEVALSQGDLVPELIEALVVHRNPKRAAGLATLLREEALEVVARRHPVELSQYVA